MSDDDWMDVLSELLAMRDQAVAEATSRALMSYLARNGLLRSTPAATVRVKRVERNEAGQITAVVETLEQAEFVA